MVVCLVVFGCFLPSSGPPLGARHLGSCSPRAQSSAAGGAGSLAISTEPTCSPHSYWLEVSGSPPRGATRSLGEAAQGLGGLSPDCRPSYSSAAMADPQPASGGLTDQAAFSCCSDPDPSTKVGAEPPSPESGPPRGPIGVQRGSRFPGSARPSTDWIRTPLNHLCSSARFGRAGVGWEKGEWCPMRGSVRRSISSGCFKACKPNLH